MWWNTNRWTHLNTKSKCSEWVEKAKTKQTLTIKYDLVCMLHRIECVHSFTVHTNTYACVTIANKKPTQMKSWAKCHDTSLNSELASSTAAKEKKNERTNVENEQQRRQLLQFIIIAFIFRFLAVFFHHVYPPFLVATPLVVIVAHPQHYKMLPCFFVSRFICSLSRFVAHICCDNKTYSDFDLNEKHIYDCFVAIRRANMRSSVAVVACATIWII